MTRREGIDELMQKTFIKLRSDYGFKRVFGSPQHADVLKKFLNALFEGRMTITDVTFHDKEILPPDTGGKKIIYDVYCTTSTGYHFVVEMQQEQSEFFGKRMIFYISSSIYRQGLSGDSFAFKPVYLIVITDFDMKGLEKRLVNEVVFMERNTNRIFTEDFKIFFLSLNQVSRYWDGCNSELERYLFLIKNMENLNKKSKPYMTGEYTEIFNASEMSSMAAEDVIAYKTSVLMEMEHHSAIDFAKEEGREEEKVSIARTLKKMGMKEEDIVKATGLTKQQINSL